jgi:plasmid rolling circle replication initiator protein Rep
MAIYIYRHTHTHVLVFIDQTYMLLYANVGENKFLWHDRKGATQKGC